MTNFSETELPFAWHCGDFLRAPLWHLVPARILSFPHQACERENFSYIRASTEKIMGTVVRVSETSEGQQRTIDLDGMSPTMNSRPPTATATSSP